MITVSRPAREKIIDLIIDENKPQVGLRVAVQGGGCSGMQYHFEFSEPESDDFIIPVDEYQMLVDPVSMQYLTGSEVDFQQSLFESKFTINNPNSRGTCGCGSSFSI